MIPVLSVVCSFLRVMSFIAVSLEVWGHPNFSFGLPAIASEIGNGLLITLMD